jgi:hypothetical protein
MNRPSVYGSAQRQIRPWLRSDSDLRRFAGRVVGMRQKMRDESVHRWKGGMEWGRERRESEVSALPVSGHAGVQVRVQVQVHVQ